MNKTTKIKNLRRGLLRWYTTNQRPLPWRRTRDPYHILISEIMLQQTQVNRVVKKYLFFLKQFPTLHKLAGSSPAKVIRAWQGMGYNNRALRLRDFAKEIVEKYHGKFPSDVNELTLLPGIGQYTAHAIACFAFEKQVPVVDVNVRRVLTRIFWKTRSLSDQKDDESIWKLAQQILPKGKAYHWNQALMDLGATICTARKPLCSICPISSVCVSAYNFVQLDRIKRVRLPSRERLYDGLPIRIYRGRIVEQMRRLNGKGTIDAYTLGARIKPTFSRRELPWLTSILRKLEKDGLVQLNSRGRATMVRLPEA